MRTVTKNKTIYRGFTLIELMISIFIFFLIAGAIIAIFVSSSSAHQKARAISSVKNNIEFAMNSIAKDVRMGHIESTARCSANGSDEKCVVLRRNIDRTKICYRISDNFLGIRENIGDAADCPTSSAAFNKLVDLSSANMKFDVANSNFYSSSSDLETAISPEQSRGWVEMNLAVIPNPGEGKEMEADQINIQVTVSTRDYGWTDTN